MKVPLRRARRLILALGTVGLLVVAMQAMEAYVAVPTDALQRASGSSGSQIVHDVARNHRLTLIAFFETWCGPCRAEMPELAALQRKFASDGLALVGVYATSSRDDVEALARATDAPYRLVHDEGGVLGRAFRIEAIPTLVLVGPDAAVLAAGHGLDASLRGRIAAILRPEAAP